MTGRGTLYLLLTVVAGAAAMLSFAALRDLARLCGFTPALAWLLPVVVDAGAASGSLVWLGAGSGESARRFARRLALGLLGLSVAANALGHGLAAYVLLPPWWVVVILSGIAPAVLGAMVHLAVLVGRPSHHLPEPAPEFTDDDRQAEERAPALAGLNRDDRPWNSTPPVAPWPPDEWALGSSTMSAEQEPAMEDDTDRAAALIAAGVGRRRLSRELGVTEYEARRLLERARPTTDSGAEDDTTTQDVVGAAAPSTAGARS